MEDKNAVDEENFENFLSDKALEKYRMNNRMCTLFLSKNGNKKLWQPNKFKVTKNSYIGEVLNERS